jgi:hypothetical protein
MRKPHRAALSHAEASVKYSLTAAAAALALSALAACSSGSRSHRATLTLDGDPHTAFAQDYVHTGAPITVVNVGICADHGAVTITRVELNNSHGLRVVDWGARPISRNARAGQPGLATQLGQGFTHEPVSTSCPKLGAAQFAISVERVGSGSGIAPSFTIHYEGGSLRVSFGVGLCLHVCTRAELASLRN